MDASHRGGQPGFIRRQGSDLILPDFAGNQFFNTLGNVLTSGRAALVIPDFVSGDVLHLTGEARLVDEETAGARYPGAERYWSLTPRHIVWRPGVLRWRSHAGAVAVEAEPHGPWQPLTRAERQRVQVAAVVQETARSALFICRVPTKTRRWRPLKRASLLRYTCRAWMARRWYAAIRFRVAASRLAIVSVLRPTARARVTCTARYRWVPNSL